MTQWQHFEENYLGAFLVCVIISLGVLIRELILGSSDWKISILFFMIATILPIGNYFSWKKKFK